MNNVMKCTKCGMTFEGGKTYGYACMYGLNCGPLEPQNPLAQEPPAMLVVESTRENEDGSLDITIELDEGATKKMAGLGAELALHCAAAGVDIQDVFDYILAQIKHEGVKEST